MGRIHQIVLGLFFSLLFLLTFHPVYAGGNYYLKQQEKEVGTDTDLDRSFHVVADDPQGVGLRMEGFIIGIEKSDRKKLGVQPLGEDPYLVEKPVGFSEQNTKEFEGRLNDGERTFISHLVHAKLDDSVAIPYIKNKLLYDAYCNKCNDERRPSQPAWKMEKMDLYDRSWEVLGKLEEELANRLHSVPEGQKAYTHVVVGSMGWNTAQEKAIRNLNSIFGNMLISQSASFKPLFIAITWPSEWNTFGVSYGNKANDADEIGFVWANALINRHLSRLRAKASEDNTWPAFKIVAVGHSLGARLVTRAAFSGAALKPSVPLEYGADLVIGLQGAFSMNRFLKERKKGKEGAPYSEYMRLCGRVALTWSKYDTANPKADMWSGANLAGAKNGYDRASDSNYRHHFAFYTATEEGGLKPNKDYPKDSKQVIYIDGSNLIKYNVLGSGGKAHSDIYNAYMGRMISNLISSF